MGIVPVTEHCNNNHMLFSSYYISVPLSTKLTDRKKGDVFSLFSLIPNKIRLQRALGATPGPLA